MKRYMKRCKEKILDIKSRSVYYSISLHEEIDMEKIVKQGLLYDFYGELLTAHQKQIFEQLVYDDMSLSEIADEAGITRQGVHDLIRRCDKILQGYEDKLHLMERFMKAKEAVSEIQIKCREYKISQDLSLIEEIEEISAGLLEEL